MKTNPIVRFIKEVTIYGMEALGKYYSSYRGIVASNEDPKHLGRVQLIIPEITGNDVHEYWAFPKGQFAGKGYGMKITPQVGELVWVEFEHGNVEVPIFELGYHAAGELPDDEDCKDPNVYWFITPRGHKIKINDTKNSIRIENRFGSAVEINEAGISQVVNTKKKIQISLGSLNKSKYKAVKGEELEDTLKDIKKFQDTLLKAIEADALEGPAKAMGKAALTAAFPQLKLLSAAIDLKTKKILSDIVTLE